MLIEEWVRKGKFQPDWREFLGVIQGTQPSRRVHFAEFLVDPEIVGIFCERYLEEKPIAITENPKAALAQYVSFFHRLGYDYCVLVDIPGLTLPFPGKSRSGPNQRSWVEEGVGVITSFSDLEAYPFPRVDQFDFSLYEYLTSVLPEGMGCLVNACGGIFETVSENLLGFTGFAYLLYDAPELVQMVFQRVGEVILDFYRVLLDFPKVVGVFQGDDLGYKTSTLVSPQIVRQFVLPWHKRLASLCHEQGKVYFLHSCGMVLPLFEDFITDVGIDAFHSFQEAVFPVTDFVRRYGNRVGTLGGVDLDYLVRLEERELRKYVSSILNTCFPLGRYALGSGNSIAHYVPFRNYLVMLDQGLTFLG
ncbi:MAG: uroporphyrinogen decarboxylase family protein [Atribacterota bacterium]